VPKSGVKNMYMPRHCGCLNLSLQALDMYFYLIVCRAAEHVGACQMLVDTWKFRDRNLLIVHGPIPWCHKRREAVFEPNWVRSHFRQEDAMSTLFV